MPNHEAMFTEMTRIATPVVKSYLTDLTTHDHNAILAMQNGDVAIWIPYKSGTRLSYLIYLGDPIDSVDWIKAYVKYNATETFYILMCSQIEEIHGVFEITKEHALDIATAIGKKVT